MTNQRLINLHRQLTQMKQQGHVFVELFPDRLKVFYNKHGKRINMIIERMNALNTEYFETKDGQPIQVNGQPVMLPGKSEEEYHQRWDEFMKSENNLIVKSSKIISL